MLVPVNSRVARKDFRDWISLPFSSAAMYRSIAMGPPIPVAFGSKYRTDRYVSVVPVVVLKRTGPMLPSSRARATELFVVPKSMPMPFFINAGKSLYCRANHANLSSPCADRFCHGNSRGPGSKASRVHRLWRRNLRRDKGGKRWPRTRIWWDGRDPTLFADGFCFRCPTVEPFRYDHRPDVSVGAYGCGRPRAGYPVSYT